LEDDEQFFFIWVVSLQMLDSCNKNRHPLPTLKKQSWQERRELMFDATKRSAMQKHRSELAWSLNVVTPPKIPAQKG